MKSNANFNVGKRKIKEKTKVRRSKSLMPHAQNVRKKKIYFKRLCLWDL